MLFKIEIIESDRPGQAANDVVAGLAKLGNGCFATAYASGQDRVIKVSRGQDWGYMSFLEAMSQQQVQNPWLPRIHWVQVFMGNSGREEDTRIVTCMERLARPWNEDGSVMNDTDPKADLWQEYVKICRDIDSHMYGNKDRSEWVNDNQELLAALKVVKQAMKACGRGTDMHCGNFMVRGRQLVITDPIGY